jgi:hypothetical protein
MSHKFTWIHRHAFNGIVFVAAALISAAAQAGQLNSTPAPAVSGPGLGVANIATILTTAPNNDDSPGALPDNNLLVAFKRFSSNAFIDIVFTVTSTAGVTEYQVSESVDNNTITSWKAYNLLLGFGTGAGFTQAGGIGDGLDFDIGPPGGNTTPPASSAMPVVTRPNEDTLVFSGGTQGSAGQIYQFRIDVPDLLSTGGTFTLRQQPTPLPGDYNRNGIVDAADYVVWRKGLGTTFTVADYNVWRLNFGQTFGSGAGLDTNNAIPEPATLGLLMLAATGCGFCRRRTA